MNMNIAQKISQELNIQTQQTQAAMALLDDGATVPFIARYRKEATGGLDDTQLRQLSERLLYLRELCERKNVIVQAIESQGKLTSELKKQIEAAESKVRLEDLYRPYMQKRRTKAQIAIEAGLEPLALQLLENPAQSPEQAAHSFINADKCVDSVDAALDGARQVLMELFANDADLISKLRQYLWEHGEIASSVISGKENEGAKFKDYFDYSEKLKEIPSHRALAIFRARKEGVLTITTRISADKDLAYGQTGVMEKMVAHHFKLSDKGRLADKWLLDTVRWAWKVKIFTHLDTEIKTAIREKAEEEAISVFARNLGDLLLAAPAGQRVTMGLDPGIRTGVKVAVVDATGKLLDTATVYPHPPKNQWDLALHQLAELVKKHQVALISIGNGTASRETDRLVGDLIKQLTGFPLQKMVVSEAGASVYSASEFAAHEFPQLDVSLRGAVSIARRLQDPLAELVKIDPKSIGVGQYQHDVSQLRLIRSLDAVVEDCVNRVGVDVNTASTPLLARVAGLNQGLAANIVQFRDIHGAFQSRKQLLAVSRLGEKAFEQCAGFLRIQGGKSPLDGSAVHPEAYPLVEKMVSQTGHNIEQIIGDVTFLRSINISDFVDDHFGEPTIRDILQELEKPGRDPRPEFKSATFKEGVESINDLTTGMIMEGVVSNVTNFGAFVDIGVHQDGLVHISALAEKFVKDPHSVVKAGDVVKVKVMEVDVKRKRIALTMRLGDAITPGSANNAAQQQKKHSRPVTVSPSTPQGAMAAAFAKFDLKSQ